MTRRIEDFIYFKAYEESSISFGDGNVSFGDGKMGFTLGVGRIDKNLSHEIKDVHCVGGLKYLLEYVSNL